jgi:hypothetical protein
MQNCNVTEFLNVDLDLDAEEGIDELLEALRPALVISRFSTRAGLELDLQPTSPEIAIRGLVTLVQKLPPDKRAIWDKAKVKSFNIGIQARANPHYTEFALPSEVLSLVHSISASIAFTVYGIREEAKVDVS